MNAQDSDLVSIGVAAELLGLSPSRVRGLVKENKLPAVLTEGGHRRFQREDVLALLHRSSSRPRAGASAPHRYPIPGPDEHAIWLDLAPSLELADPALGIAQYVVTEMVNNAIDHSNGTCVSTAHERDERGRIVVAITDDGDGIFQHLADGLHLDDIRNALAELTKGKQTTDPQRHTGEGIFFSSKSVDEFTLEANGYRLIFDTVRHDVAFGESTVREGTTVTVTLDPATTLTLAELFGRFTTDFEFNRTRPRIKLYEFGVRFISRSEAKRLTVGLEKFSEVELDFARVEDIGQGFADELFRVWATDHPSTALLPIGMNSAVEFMVNRVRLQNVHNL
jgi:excisionase family DNA binding protein